MNRSTLRAVSDYQRRQAHEPAPDLRRWAQVSTGPFRFGKEPIVERPIAPSIITPDLHLQAPAWAECLIPPMRYKGAKGGRASGKSHFFAERAVERMAKDPNLRVVCIREIQQSLKFSSQELIKRKIQKLDVAHLFDVRASEIRRIGGDGIVIFIGMQEHNAESIKSLEGFGVAWVDEAQNISQRSLDLLLPTIRTEGSEIWFSWNPENASDAVDVFFKKGQKGAVCTKLVTYADNPFCPQVMHDEAARAEADDAETYEHVWKGGYNLGKGGRIYKKFVNRDFPHGNIDDTVRDYGGDIYVGQDFNVNPMASVLAAKVGDECHVFDALEVPTSNTQEVADELKRRYPNRRIIICPDPAGKQRHTNAPVGQTDFTILENAGFRVHAPNSHPAIVDRENNANQMYEHKGRRRVRIHPSAAALVTGLSNLTYKPGTSQRDKKSGYDHICDAMDYLLWQEFNVLAPKVLFTTMRM